MLKPKQVANFLNELQSDSMKSAFGSLSSLLDELENKNDPEPIEIEIVSTAYQLLEKLNLLQAALRKYSNDNGTLTGTKLDSLYSNDGILIDDD